MLLRTKASAVYIEFRFVGLWDELFDNTKMPIQCSPFEVSV